MDCGASVCYGFMHGVTSLITFSFVSSSLFVSHQSFDKCSNRCKALKDGAGHQRFFSFFFLCLLFHSIYSLSRQPFHCCSLGGNSLANIHVEVLFFVFLPHVCHADNGNRRQQKCSRLLAGFVFGKRCAQRLSQTDLNIIAA